MKVFIVVADASKRDVLQSVLPSAKLHGVRIAASDGRHEQSSLASTLLVTERAPLALVHDADATSPEVIQEQREWLDALVTRFSVRTIPFRIVMAIPSLEAIFFERPEILESVAGGKLSDRVLLMAKYSAKDAIAEIGKLRGRPLSLSEIASSLGPAELDMVREHPVIKELMEFLDEAHAASGAVGRPQLAKV